MTFTDFDLSVAQTMGEGFFPGHVGLTFSVVETGRVCSQLDVVAHHLAPNGFLHAGVVVTLADTSCGYGVRTCAPETAIGFTTVELKSNFLSTAAEGIVECEARLQHGGRTTQVWDAVVSQGERKLALFRCTQLLLHPR